MTTFATRGSFTDNDKFIAGYMPIRSHFLASKIRVFRCRLIRLFFPHDRNGKTVGAAGRRGGRNERIVVSATRDGKLHGPAMNKTVAARALGWRSEMSAVNRTHGPARC